MPTNVNRQKLIEKHSFVRDSIFRLKSTALIGSRVVKNLLSQIHQFKDEGQLLHEPVIASSESDLWNPFDNKDNWILTAGKIENLRIAARKISGLEIKAHQVFSFWKHIGNPNFGKGYVVGREIREGCIVPTIAGGLCQLSNALYDAALKANFDIIERHKHTKIIRGSLAEQDRDATVKWNYIDLRFQSSFDFRIDIELTSDKLIVTFRSKQKNPTTQHLQLNIQQPHTLNDCYSCGSSSCFKHPDKTVAQHDVSCTTFILDEKWPEFDEYVKRIATSVDCFIVPLRKNTFVRTDRYSWSASNSRRLKATTKQALYRAFKLRSLPKNRNNVFELSLQLDKKIARAAAKQIPIESTHIVISQNLLPFVFEIGALGGRTFDVLMTRLPLEKLHQRLDFAHAKYPDSPTLQDFRAPWYVLDMENKALNKARKIITPHAEIADIFRHKVEKLNWVVPPTQRRMQKGSQILFPASAVGRKGAYEIRQVAKELQLDLVIAGGAIEKDGFWEDVQVEKFNGDFDNIAVVLYPAYVEHQPRQLLKAISKGIPVITTTACGIDSSDTVTVLEIGNLEQLKHEVRKYRERNATTDFTVRQ